MERHELIKKLDYYLERITAEEQALALPGLTDQSRKDLLFLHEVDTKKINEIIQALDGIK